MKKIVICLFLYSVTLIGYSQDGSKMFSKPDFEAIKKSISDKSSPLYYQTLLKRYNDDDTTLSIKEYWYLYYGSSLQPGYSPYGKPDLNDDLTKVLKKENRDESDIDKIIDLEKRILKEYPFNLRNLNTLVNMYDKKKDTLNADRTYKKLLGVGRAMLSTGDGLSDSTAIYVISVDHEYDMMGLMGYEFAGNQKLIHSKGSQMDYMKVKGNKGNVEALYFNVDRLFAKMSELLKKDD